MKCEECKKKDAEIKRLGEVCGMHFDSVQHKMDVIDMLREKVRKLTADKEVK